MTFLSSCTSGGCGAKIGPADLSELLTDLPRVYDPHLIVGFDSADDGAAYQISEEQTLISTVDFFSPMIDDPKTFGRIAAANALSDVYAMGGEVLFALNLVCFPQKMDKAYLKEMLAGGAEKISEANASLAGGHSIYDHEPKYGLAVTGRVEPKGLLRNNTPQAEDILILTKGLGVGLILSALRGELVSPEAEQAAITSMEHLNKYAAEAMKKFPIHACTDVTGFGLAGHATEMAGEAYTLVIDTEQLPILPGAYEYAREHLATAGGQRNRLSMAGKAAFDHIDSAFQELLSDPQTSGGLLISVAPEAAADLLSEIQKTDPIARIIGEVIPRQKAEALILL